MANEGRSLAQHEEDLRAVPLHARMGLRILDHGPHTLMTMELTDDVRGLAPGSVHGGMLATFADAASAVSLDGAFVVPTEVPVTTDIHVRYYRQPNGGPITAEANLIHRGRRLLSTECSIKDVQQRVLARSTATYMIVPVGG